MKTETNLKNNTMEMKLSFEIFGDWYLGDTKWCVVCNETQMVIGCNTKKLATELKRNWTSWEYVDQTKLRPETTFRFWNKTDEETFTSDDSFDNIFNLLDLPKDQLTNF